MSDRVTRVSRLMLSNRVADMVGAEWTQKGAVMTKRPRTRQVSRAGTPDIGTLTAELHYHAADLRISHPEAARILREAADDLVCGAGDESTDSRLALPDSVRGAIEYALSSKH